MPDHPEQIVCVVDRPRVVIRYVPPHKDCDALDRLAAAELALVALARHTIELRAEHGLPVKGLIMQVASSDVWKPENLDSEAYSLKSAL